MAWREDLINDISDYTKLVLGWSFHGGSCPRMTPLLDKVLNERNRLIVQGNERLKRIEDLEAQVKNLNICNDDLRDMVDELSDDKASLVNTIRSNEEAMTNMSEYIDELINE